MLKSEQMHTTPLTEAVRRAIKGKGLDFVAVADKLGMKQNTFAARVTKQSPLHLDSPRDLEFVAKVASAIGVDRQEIIDQAHQIALNGAFRSSHDVELVDALLDNLENPQMSQEAKQRARRALKRLMGLEEEM